MNCPKPVTIDFETYAIEARPAYPPKPVGVAIKWPGKPGKYFSFAHPNGPNNSTHTKAKQELAKALKHKDGILFQNAKFDIDVMETHMGLKAEWHQIHDTMFLLFLDDPHSDTLSLKPSAERYLDMPPEERDAVADWILENQPAGAVAHYGRRIPKSRTGAYIAFAPAGLVGKYAIGDVVRTERLFRLLYPKIVDEGMLDAYELERELMPILLESERQGVRVHLARLIEDVETYQGAMESVDAWLRKKLKSPELNIGSGKQLIQALIDAGFADEGDIPVTAKGNMKSDKGTIKEVVKNPTLISMLAYRSQLQTCLKTFMVPWMETAIHNDGLIFTHWNQVRSADYGARTGRLSSSPNFQNIPREFKPLWKHEGKGLPKTPIVLPPLPAVRSYVAPWDDGSVLIGRDYSQQELRILAYVEDGALRNAYLSDPWLDLHSHAQKTINDILKTNFERKPIKNTAFGLIYGMGLGKLAIQSSCTVEEAATVRRAYMQHVVPGLQVIYADMKARAKRGEPVYTWNRRRYYCEEPRIVNGRIQEFDYKLLNVVVQGSAAECTKRAIINYHKRMAKTDRFYLTVHDEFLSSVPKRSIHAGMKRLKQAMEDVDFNDIPMVSEGATSPKDWAHMEDYDKKGVRV